MPLHDGQYMLLDRDAHYMLEGHVGCRFWRGQHGHGHPLTMVAP